MKKALLLFMFLGVIGLNAGAALACDCAPCECGSNCSCSKCH